jgi:hypothetical protein
MKPNTLAHCPFWLQYRALHPAVHCAIAEILGPWYEHVAATGAEVQAELLAAVAPQGAG